MVRRHCDPAFNVNHNCLQTLMTFFVKSILQRTSRNNKTAVQEVGDSCFVGNVITYPEETWF